jgi:hypothetical protein
VIKEILIGSAISHVKGQDKAATRINYFRGNDPSEWKTGVSAYNIVSLGEVYKEIELKLKAYGNNVEKLFYLKPGADSQLINVKIDGARTLRVSGRGELEAETDLGIVRFTKPFAYQEIGGKRQYVKVAYAVKGDVYGFKLGDYDREKELVIDPLLASTFLGGSNSDRAYCVSTDLSGNVYVAGYTYSSDFPTSSGAYDEAFNWMEDAFVSKLDGNLSQLLASTFLGGANGSDRARSISIDSSGNVYVTGRTGSSDFPTSAGAYDTSYNGSGDAFVSKLDGNLQLLASTLLAGTAADGAHCVSIDSSGNVYVAGKTRSSDFPTSAGAYDTSHNGSGDAFVSKLDSDLEQLLASTFLGGTSADWAYCLAVSSGNVYVAGETYSSAFPTSSGAYDEVHNGSGDAFVSKLDSDLEQLLASTFLGGTSADWAYCLAISSGNVYVAGETYSSAFPTSAGAYDETYNSSGDAFVSKLDGSLELLSASTFLGGGEYDIVNSISIDSGGKVYAAGYTGSSDFPTSAGAYDEVYNGSGDAFISRLGGNLDQLLVSTFLGGDGWDNPYCISIDSSSNVYVAGSTSSSGFPTSATTLPETPLYQGLTLLLVPTCQSFPQATHMQASMWEVN